MRARDTFTKVPQVTALFWVAKIVATTLGETGGDALSMSMDFGYLLSSGIFGTIFVLAVIAQVQATRYRPEIYWLTLTATTMVGTTLADFADRSLGVGYAGGSALLLGMLLLSFWWWYRVTGTLSVDTVQAKRAEAHYWITVLFSQTLGTAVGDWVVDTAGLGYRASAIGFGALLAVIAALYLWTRTSRTALFWAAFVLTRPLGAVLGDYLDKPLTSGGLALSRVSASTCLLALLIGSVFLSQRTFDKASRRSR